jgi:hypothetical protein
MRRELYWRKKEERRRNGWTVTTDLRVLGVTD